MKGTEQFFNTFSWSFTLACLYDIVYLFFFWRHKHALGVFLLILLVISVTYFSRDSGMQNPWDKLGELMLIFIVLALIGCGLISIATYVAYQELKKHDYTWATMALLLVHAIAFSIGVLAFIFFPQLIEKLLG